MTARAAAMNTIQVGQIGLTFVPDGSIHIGPPAAIYKDAPADLFASNQHFLDEDGYLVMSLGSLLIETRDRKVLVDLGWGNSTANLATSTGGRFEGYIEGGKLLANLERLGLTPADIDAVLISHLHKDHVGWLTTETRTGPQLTFARADHFLAARELDFWTHRTAQSLGPSDPELELLASKMTPLEDGGHPAPGIDAVFTPGHTPGHFSFVVSDQGSHAVLLGDTVHCPLEISDPELALVADVDPVIARATREKLFRRLDGDQTVLAEAHFPDFVFGRVISSGAGRTVQRIAAATAADKTTT
jgi:glyoxylase-like metal-dependent hydrolase (beta-lactamase superfamily II)